ncbi:hypothetical protein [Nostoc favosum]|uniref:Uncharacterized protein n=1 Tax=Nostoc favosum CHAB5714 TaxID=2780399 RepID=A0ABS8IER0_9NOSO|nr:hypothetical protein [Nostoc favosum]MCC5602720.1 hypothetical protein [Nostoc favosum CHAB5714]
MSTTGYAYADSWPRAIAFHLTPTIGVNYDHYTRKKVRQITTKAVFTYPNDYSNPI